MSDAMFVFTVEHPDLILQQGGTQYWKVRDWRVRECEYVVCVQNRNLGDRDWCQPTEPHGSAFLIGHISDVVPSEEEGRFLVKMRDFSRIVVPDVWQGWRFPVRYMPLSNVGIDPTNLQFQPMPVTIQPAAPAVAVREEAGRMSVGESSLADAVAHVRRELARLGISEITIRA
jgi:hypothetical protein